MPSPQSIYGADYKANISDPAVNNRLEFGGSGVFYVDTTNPFSKSPISTQTIDAGASVYFENINRTVVAFVGSPDVSKVPEGNRCVLNINTGVVKQYLVDSTTTGAVLVEGDITGDLENVIGGVANVYYAYKGAVIQFIEDSQINVVEESNVVGLVNCSGKTFSAGSFLYGEFDSLSLTSGFAKVYLY